MRKNTRVCGERCHPLLDICNTSGSLSGRLNFDDRIFECQHNRLFVFVLNKLFGKSLDSLKNSPDWIHI
jgi:hypothetical protein